MRVDEYTFQGPGDNYKWINELENVRVYERTVKIVSKRINDWEWMRILSKVLAIGLE